MTRRELLFHGAAAPGAWAAGKRARHWHAAIDGTPVTGVHPKPPRGFSLIPIAPGARGPLLKWRDMPASAGWLRIASGFDDREPKQIEVRFGAADDLLGVMDVRFACDYQPFEWEMDRAAAGRAKASGLRLSLTAGAVPFYLLIPNEAMLPQAPMLAPHFMTAGTRSPLEEFRARLDSFDCLQELSWMEGCVLEALDDLGMARAAGRYLDYFFDRPLGEIPASLWGSSEQTLPLAALARHRPRHPAIDRAIENWCKWRAPEATGKGHAGISAEGCYTFGYPCAVVARLRRSAELEQLAVRQLRARRDRLIAGEQFFLRHYEDGRRTYPGWARGLAWYSLGYAKTLSVLDGRNDLSDLHAELRRVLLWTIARQRPDGLWSCFVDDHAIAPDTSGSSGIAAAIAIAVRRGWLPEAALAPARRARQALRGHLTPDGLLRGVSQSNKPEAGESLQRSGYRVILQFGMGLFGQMEAALGG